MQFPIFGLPREIGLKGAVFADAGTLFGYTGQTNFATIAGFAAGTPCVPGNVPGNTPQTNFTQGSCITLDDERTIRSSVGASLIWSSPLGPIRIDYAFPVTKGKYDQTQYINFSGGSTF